MTANSRSRSRSVAAGDESAVGLGILPDLIGYHVRLAQIAIFSHFERALEALDLSPGLFALLVIIDANPGLRQSRLAEAAKLDRSTLVPALDKLEDRGLVERRADLEDRRSNGLFLTPDGRRLLGRAERAVRDHETAIAAALDAEERARLIHLLDRLAPGER